LPSATGVGRLPDTAVVDADKKYVWLGWYADGADRPAGPEWADHPPSHALIKRSVDGL